MSSKADGVSTTAQTKLTTDGFSGNVPVLALNEAVEAESYEVEPTAKDSVKNTSGPVLLVPIIFAVLALVAVSRRKITDK